MREVNTSFKTFMDIFKVDEVKKYVNLKEENVKMDAAKFITDHDNMKKIMNDVMNDNVDELKKVYYKQMGEEHMELVAFIVEVIRKQPKEHREQLIESALPKTKRYFLEMLEDIEKNDI